MATLIFTAIGTLIGGPLGGSVGTLLGRQVDALVFGGSNREGPRLSELSVTTSSYGFPLPRQYGRMRIAGQIIWATDLVEHKEKHGNGKGKPSTTEYSYTASFAVALASRPLRDIGRIWADGKLLRGSAGDLKTGGTLRFHSGEGDQQPDPLLAAAEGAARSPAYRGLAYVVFEDLQLGDFGNRIPALTFEVIADSAPLSLDLMLEDVVDECDAAVPLTGVAGLTLDGPVVEALAALDPFFPVDCDACDTRLAVRPGAVVTVPGHPGKWRVREWEWREHGVDLTLMRQSPAVTSTTSADPGRMGQLPDLALTPTRLVACELPWDGNAGTPVPLLLAAASSAGAGWTGASLYADQGDSALLPLGTSGRTRAPIGTALSALPPASPLLFDRHGSVTVELIAADLQLTDATMRQLAMGANRALLGNEIVQFAFAEPLGNGRWKLSGLWRGRGGTEGLVATHAAGETFMVLGNSGIVLDPEAVGNVPGTMIAAIGLGDSTPAVAPIALRGIGTRPLAPVHGALSQGADGTIVLSWTRRARGAWNWTDGVDTPLNEQIESYEIAFGPVASPLARWETSQPALIVPANEMAGLANDAPDGPFAVRQRGDQGVSEPLLIYLS